MTTVREKTQHLVTLHTKALVWLRRHALEDNRVKIQQLASSLRVGVAQAQEIVGFLMRNQSDRHAFGAQYKIFVDNNQVPEWMRKYLSPSSHADVLMEARKITNTVMHRDLHRRVLAQTYGCELKAYVLEEYLNADIAVMIALQSIGVEEPQPVGEYPQLDKLDHPQWYEGLFGNSVNLHHHRTMPNDTKVVIHFGAMSDESQDTLNYDTQPQFEVMHHHKCKLTPEQTATCIEKVRSLIDEMQRYGYGLNRVNKTYSVQASSGRTVLVFGKKGDLGITISITMPWDYLMLKPV